MAFHDVILPVTVSYGSKADPHTSANIVQTASGRRFVNVLWDFFRWEYDLRYDIQSSTDFETLRTFFLLRNGPQHSFRVWDESFNSMTANVQGTWALGTVSAFQLSNTTFQLRYKFADSAYSYYQKITKPNTTYNFIVYWGETAKAEGVDYTVDYATGIVTWITGHVPPDTTVISVTCKFHRHCHFTEVNIPASWEEYSLYTFDPIKIEEEKED